MGKGQSYRQKLDDAGINTRYQNPVVSLDNGATYFAWTSPITLGILAAHTSRTILIRGILSPAAAAGEIINTAVAESTTPGPNPDNNTSTDRTPIRAFADLSIITKSTCYLQ